MTMVASKFCWADVLAEDDEETSWQVGSCGFSRQSLSDLCSDEADACLSLSVLELSEEGPQDRSRKLSFDAPEFIPTLSTACPAVCVGTLRVENKDCESASGTPQSCPKLAQRRKVQFAHLEVQAQVPQIVRGEDHRKSHQGVMPDASEDEWLRRRDTRIRALSVAKNTREYQNHSSSKLDIERSVDEPMTPDPADRTMSARRWKYEVQQWRSALSKKWEQDGHSSVVSTEDCVSDTVSSAATDEF